jgi:hypothetical protein
LNLHDWQAALCLDRLKLDTTIRGMLACARARIDIDA